MDKDALKIQSAWRGKRERKLLKKKTVSAIAIQRIVRGFFAKREFTQDVENFREQKVLKKERRQRLAAIKTREHDLRMLAQISPEQYFAYDKLRQNRAAKCIQHSWRNKQMLNLRPKQSSLEDYYQPSAKYQSFGYKTVKVDRYREEELRKSRDLYSSISKNDPLLDKTEAFYKDIVAKYEAKLEDPSFSPRNDDRLDIKAEDIALGLDSLFQNIRSQALQRQTEEGKSNVTSFGNYRELLKQRQRMEMLLSDYYASMDESEYNKIDRVKSLLHSQRLMEDMQSLPSLDDVVRMTESDLNVNKTYTEEQTKQIAKTRHWFDDHPEDFTHYLDEAKEYLVNDLDNSKPTPSNRGGYHSSDVIRKSIYAHLQMTDQLAEARWKTFLLPIHVQGQGNSNEQKDGKKSGAASNVSRYDAGLRDSLCVEDTLDKPRFVLSALPTKFDASGTSAEDSLKWVSYCLNGITNEVIPKELRSLRNRVLHSALHPHAYRESAEAALQRDYAEVRQKAKIIEQRVMLELKAQAMKKLGKAFALSTRQQQEQSATIIQAAMRSFMTRRHLREMIARRRIDQALHQLLHEVAQIEGNKDSRFSRLSSILQQPKSSALELFLPQPPANTSAGKQQRQKQAQQDVPATAAKSTVQSSLDKYTMRSMLSPIVPPNNNQFTPRSNSIFATANTPLVSASSHVPSSSSSNINNSNNHRQTQQSHHAAVPPLSSIASINKQQQKTTPSLGGSQQQPPIRSIWDDRRLYEADAKEQKIADETPLHKRGDYNMPQQQPQQQQMPLSAFSTSAPNTGRRPEPPTLAAPSLTARSIKSVQFASQLSGGAIADQQQPVANSPMNTARLNNPNNSNNNNNNEGNSIPTRTPLSARGTPTRSQSGSAVPHSTISSAGGDVLSPFMGLNDVHADDGEGYGYISTPSLSRSLTESFGKVDSSNRDKQ